MKLVIFTYEGATQLPPTYLQLPHVWFVLPTHLQGIQDEPEKIKCFRLLHVHQKNPSHKAEALAVSHFLVQHRVRLQGVKQTQLAMAELSSKVRVAWVRATWDITEMQ